MFDVIALGELLIDFAPQSVNEAGYPVLSANHRTGKPWSPGVSSARKGCEPRRSKGRARIWEMQ